MDACVRRRGGAQTEIHMVVVVVVGGGFALSGEMRYLQRRRRMEMLPSGK